MRPPMSSDSEDDYDGFSFGNEFEVEKHPKKLNASSAQWLLTQQRDNDDLNKIVLCVKNGDLDEMKQELLRRYGSEAKIKYGDYLKDGWTLLLHAVSNVQLHVVSYLINKKADVNCEADSLTPLMLICKQEAYPSQKDDIRNMTKYLLEQGAIVNVRDKTGLTPFMYACIFGNMDIVDLLLNLSAIDAVDNFGKTALHYAVENRHFDITKMLIHAGAETDIYDSAGLTPRDIAISLGLTEFENLFPVEITDCLPSAAEHYKSYQDLAPMIFPDHKISAYFQDIPKLLRGMRAEQCAKEFYKANISLSEFLTIDDSRLQSIGIVFEYQRKRILHGLLKFHGHEFSPKSIELVLQEKHKNMYEYFEMYAGYLKHLIMMKSAIIYLWKIGGLRNVHQRTIRDMLASLDGIQKDVLLLQNCVQQISSTSTKNPLFIGSTTSQSKRYKKVLRPFLKYTILIGMGLFLSYKIIKLVP